MDQNHTEDEIIYRSHRPGDMGWIIHRHGIIYTSEFGWNESVEGHIASVMALFSATRDPQRERFYIAERRGQILGSVLLCIDRGATSAEEIKEADARTARVRVFLVERAARGMGVGRQLLQRSVDFARRSGYERIILSTVTGLVSARKLYVGAGFRMVHVGEGPEFTPPGSIHETWQLDL